MIKDADHVVRIAVAVGVMINQDLNHHKYKQNKYSLPDLMSIQIAVAAGL